MMVARLFLLLLACLGFVAVPAGCGGATAGPGRPIRVYTRNLYLGAPLTPLAAIPSPAAVPDMAAALWAQVQASNFPERAKVLAAEIVRLKPDLVALQEVSLYRRQIPSDYRAGDATPNATEVVLDFLATLMAEIDGLGGGYRVANEARNVDVELPVSGGGDGLFDLRLTDRDVVLARDGVAAASPIVTPYQAKFIFNIGGGGGVPLSLTRSVSRVQVVVGGAAFTIANSHLEVELLSGIQMAQANELVAELAHVSDSLLLLGDFNSQPGLNSYPLLAAAFRDAYLDGGGSDAGATCCQDDDLMNPLSKASERIDLVLYRGPFRVRSVRVVGSDPAADRTASGLWPSDHFGALADLELPAQ
jgi:endonuclease/exonuclease/phosphatase family metal-dependent hydrolase